MSDLSLTGVPLDGESRLSRIKPAEIYVFTIKHWPSTHPDVDTKQRC